MMMMVVSVELVEHRLQSLKMTGANIEYLHLEQNLTSKWL